jgi:hypothetical protein
MHRHIPQRSCIVCGLKTAKDDLFRIVRRPDGSLNLDRGGRLSGRGAYVCESAKCWEAAVDGGAVQRALKVRLESGTLDRLRSEFRSMALHTETLE